MKNFPNNLNNPSTLNNLSTPITPSTPSTPSTPTTPITPTNHHLFLPQHGHYRHLRVYQVTEALYDLTFLFCQRFLPAHGDRTVDQMVQAARSGKQNIAEGNQAAATSSETEIKLTNVARASLEELLADYEDYLRTRQLPQWGSNHPRQAALRAWTCSRAFDHEYALKAAKMSDEELANLCITLCHQAIYMLGQLLKSQQGRFVTEGGIKEQMHKARTGYRQQQDAELQALREENARLRQRLAELETLINQNNQNNQSTPITPITPTTPKNEKAK